MPDLISTQLRAMLLATKDGRFAVRPDDDSEWKFLRLSRPRKGSAAGYLKIQTLHSERWMSAVDIHTEIPTNLHVHNKAIVPALMLVAIDPATGILNFARELDVCGCCGKQLTDDRSRYYGIGPECEKKWPEMITNADEPYVPGKKW